MTEANRYLELRVYSLFPGMREAFHTRFVGEIMPMLHKYGITVVTAGPSLHDDNGYCLIRAYPSLTAREEALGRFYGSEEWIEQHDEAVMAMIDSYNTVVLEAEPALVAAMASSPRAGL